MSTIPQYLRKYAYDEKRKKDIVTFRIKCTCGCETFSVFENVHTEEETSSIKDYNDGFPDTGYKNLHGYVDKNGKMRMYVKKFFFFRKYIDIPFPPPFMYVNVVKITCASCKEELILFDSRYHGYDGMTSEDEEIRKYSPQFARKGNSVYKIEVTVENEVDLEAFIEMTGEECSYEFYSDSFISIDIFGTDKDGKRTMLCSFETA